MGIVKIAIRRLRLAALVWEAGQVSRRMGRAYARGDVEDIAWCRVDLMAIKTEIDRL